MCQAHIVSPAAELKASWARQLRSYAAAHAAPLLSGLVGLVVLPRVLGTESYGHYAVALGVATASAGILSDWIVPAGLRLSPEARSEGDELWRVLGVLAVGAGLIGGLLAGVLVAPLGGLIALAAGALAFASSAARPFGAWLRAMMRTGAYAGLSAASACGSLVLGVGLYLATRSLFSLLLAACLPGLVASVWYAWNTRWPTQLPRGRAWYTRALTFGLPIAITGIGGQVLLVADRYLLALLAGSSEAGRYAATYGAAEKLVGLPFAVLFSAMYPLGAAVWVAGSRGEALELVRTVGRAYSLIAGGLVVFQAFSGRWLMALVAGEVFRPPGLLPVLVSFGTWLWYLGILQHQLLEWEKRTPTITVLTLSAAGLNIVTNALLIPSFALVGAGAATTTAYATYLVAATIVTGRYGVGPRVWQVRPLIVAGGLALAGQLTYGGSAGPAVGCGGALAYITVTLLVHAWRIGEVHALIRRALGVTAGENIDAL